MYGTALYIRVYDSVLLYGWMVCEKVWHMLLNEKVWKQTMWNHADVRSSAAKLDITDMFIIET